MSDDYPKATYPPLPETFTGRAHRAIELAEAEAHTLGHAYLGPEHLLLGLAREGQDRAEQAGDGPSPLDLALGDIREAIGKLLHGRADEAVDALERAKGHAETLRRLAS